MILSLPWPPSVNVYWRNVAGKTLVSRAGCDYARDVYGCVLTQSVTTLTVFRKTFAEPVSVDIIAYPPNRARRDLDNLPKAILDALTKARLWEDDSLVHDLRVRWGEVRKGGEIQITIKPMEAKECTSMKKMSRPRWSEKCARLPAVSPRSTGSIPS